MKVGDRVRVVRIPEGLKDDERMQTKSLFELCRGRIFRIAGLQPVPKIGSELIQLEVGKVVGKLACMHTIWIEKKFVEMVEEPG